MNESTVMERYLLAALVEDGEREQARYEGREPVVLQTWHCYACGNHIGQDTGWCESCIMLSPHDFSCFWCKDHDGGCDRCNSEPTGTCSLCGEQVDVLEGPDVEASCNACREKYDLNERGPVSLCVDPSCKTPVDGEGLCDKCSTYWERQFSDAR